MDGPAGHEVGVQRFRPVAVEPRVSSGPPGMNIDELLDERMFNKIGIPREDPWRWDEREGISLVFTRACTLRPAV